MSPDISLILVILSVSLRLDSPQEIHWKSLRFTGVSRGDLKSWCLASASHVFWYYQMRVWPGHWTLKAPGPSAEGWERLLLPDAMSCFLVGLSPLYHGILECLSHAECLSQNVGLGVLSSALGGKFIGFFPELERGGILKWAWRVSSLQNYLRTGEIILPKHSTQQPENATSFIIVWHILSKFQRSRVGGREKR